MRLKLRCLKSPNGCQVLSKTFKMSIRNVEGEYSDIFWRDPPLAICEDIFPNLHFASCFSVYTQEKEEITYRWHA